MAYEISWKVAKLGALTHLFLDQYGDGISDDDLREYVIRKH